MAPRRTSTTVRGPRRQRTLSPIGATGRSAPCAQRLDLTGHAALGALGNGVHIDLARLLARAATGDGSESPHARRAADAVAALQFDGTRVLGGYWDAVGQSPTLVLFATAADSPVVERHHFDLDALRMAPGHGLVELAEHRSRCARSRRPSCRRRGPLHSPPRACGRSTSAASGHYAAARTLSDAAEAGKVSPATRSATSCSRRRVRRFRAHARGDRQFTLAADAGFGFPNLRLALWLGNAAIAVAIEHFEQAYAG